MFGGILMIEYFRLHIGYFLMFCFYVKKIQSNHNSQKTNNKQITMTKIQNSKQLVFDLI